MSLGDLSTVARTLCPTSAVKLPHSGPKCLLEMLFSLHDGTWAATVRAGCSQVVCVPAIRSDLCWSWTAIQIKLSSFSFKFQSMCIFYFIKPLKRGNAHSKSFLTQWSLKTKIPLLRTVVKLMTDGMKIVFSSTSSPQTKLQRIKKCTFWRAHDVLRVSAVSLHKK